MRMTSFFLGSMLGMVGAVMLMQRKSGMAQAVQTAMSDMKGNVMSKAMSKFTKSEATNQAGQAQAQKQSSGSTSNVPANHQMNVSMIEGIINSDPELQATVEDIKSDSSSIKH